MSISQIGATTTIYDTGAPASLTKSYTQVEEINTIIIVGIVCQGATHDSVTFDGQALTKLTENIDISEQVSMWYRVNPNVTTANVVLTMGNEAKCGMMITSWKNVHQTTPFSNSANDNDEDGSPTVVCTSAVGELVIDFFIHADSSQPGVGTGQTQLVNIEADFRMGSSYEAGSTNVTMSWSSAPTKWASVAGSLSLSASENNNTHQMML